jgi:hypothetical protein
MPRPRKQRRREDTRVHQLYEYRPTVADYEELRVQIAEMRNNLQFIAELLNITPTEKDEVNDSHIILMTTNQMAFINDSFRDIRSVMTNGPFYTSILNNSSSWPSRWQLMA